MNNEVVAEAAAELLDMRASRRVVPDLPAALRPETLSDAYAIQDRVVAALLAPDAARCIGYKVACTNEIAQAALQIDRPVFGRLMSQTTSPGGTTLPADRFTHRVIEAEFAFRVATDVEPVEGGHTPATIAEHLDALIPGIEIVDYRFESWAVGALRIAADNAIHGWWLRGDPPPWPSAACRCALRSRADRDGEAKRSADHSASRRDSSMLMPAAAARVQRHDCGRSHWCRLPPVGSQVVPMRPAGRKQASVRAGGLLPSRR